MILYEKLYEREGNDAWLKDYVELHYNAMGLYLSHKKSWSGWSGDDNENHTLELNSSDLEKSQKLIDEYIDRHSLYEKFSDGSEEGIKIDLKELMDEYLSSR